MIQTNAREHKSANLKAVSELIEAAVKTDKPDMIVLPEQFDILAGSKEKIAAAEVVPGGPAYELCRMAAIKHHVAIHAGSFTEYADARRAYNTTVVFDRQGKEIAKYRKIHLFDVTTPDGSVYAFTAMVRSSVAI